jgi:predicted amidohydrolase
MLRIAVCQLPLNVENHHENIDLANSAIQEAAAQGAKLVVLPELTNSGCVFRNIDELEERATTLDGALLKEWAALAYQLKVVLVAGLAIKESGCFYNVSVIIDSTGLRGCYKKVHLWNDEIDFFTPGTEPPLIVDTDIGRIATMVCYDIEFPEWVRLTMLGDATILALPINWPDTGRPSTQTPLIAVLVQAAASQNKLVIAAADRTRTERDVAWVGSSVIADSDGLIKVMADRNMLDEAQVLVVDVEVPENRKLGPRNDARTDRKPELYQKLLNK